MDFQNVYYNMVTPMHTSERPILYLVNSSLSPVVTTLRMHKCQRAQLMIYNFVEAEWRWSAVSSLL